MIPVLTTMVGLLVLLVAIDVIERDGARGGQVLSFVAALIAVAALAGTAYVWYLSAEVTRQMEEVDRQVEQMWP